MFKRLLAQSQLMMSRIAQVPRPIDLSVRSVVAATACLFLGACVHSDHLPREQARTPRFDPIAFFTGTTEGRGSLKVMFRARQQTLVMGQGRTTSDGDIVLDQQVRRGSVSARRTWRLRRTGADRYAGTLSDASGPVLGTVAGNCLHLTFAMKGGLRAEQWLYLQPDGQTARNRMVVTMLGVPVARLDETIGRLAP